jgi:hypothetical protein
LVWFLAALCFVGILSFDLAARSGLTKQIYSKQRICNSLKPCYFSCTMPNNRQRHFHLLAAQFEMLLQTLSECDEPDLRRDFLIRMRLILDEVYEIELKESPSLESEHPRPELDSLVY